MFFSKKYKIIVKNKNITIEAKSGSNLYQILLENDIPIQSLCSGNGQCGKCKVKIAHAEGKEINKPTKKDRLMIALVNLDAGYRLACEYNVKQDIIVDTEEWIAKENYNPEIVSIKVSPKPTEDKPEEKQETQPTKSESESESISEVITEHIEDNQSEHTQEIKDKKSTPEEEKTFDYEVNNGLILIQYNKGIKYFYFSTGIDNISHSGLVKTDESLVNLIDDNTISDFIYDNIKVPDFERIIFVLDKPNFSGKNLLNIINYYKFELGSVLCEVIQPQNNPRQLMSFFRLTSNLKNNSLIISFDALNNVHYVNSEGKVYNLDLNHITNEYNFEELFFLKGKNPVQDLSEDFNSVKIKEPFMDPDCVTISAKLKTLHNMLSYGVINQDFSFNERQSIIDKVPIEILIKLSQKNDKKIFYIYRKRGVALYIDEEFIEKIKYLKIVLTSLIEYVENNLGKIQNISINSFIDYENLINYLLDLNIIPKKFSKKISFFSGDPTVLATRFFTVPNIEVYVTNKIDEILLISLFNDEEFNKIFDNKSKRLS